MLNHKIGILLVNLGTPDSFHPKDVHRYLIEFLTDGRVIDTPWFLRQLLVRGAIVPKRYKQSAASYEAIWTENGSPLLIYTEEVKKSLQAILDEKFIVEIAMRYQNPSLEKGIEILLNSSIDHLVVLPLFPQYASATTGSVYAKVMSLLKRYQRLPKLTFIDQFATHPAFIKAFSQLCKGYDINSYDHILFSFHGLPQRHVVKADQNQWCLKKPDCCEKLCAANRHCYSSQCYATAMCIAEELNLSQNQFSISFQSRLGKEPWLQPYTSDVIEQLAHTKKKNILVFCPSFVCDCLETLFEIGVEYQKEFQQRGGEKLELVTGLNSESFWVEALKEIIESNLYTPVSS